MTQPEPAAPPGRRRGFFVYYKIAGSRADRLRAAFARAASFVSSPPPWRAELMRRVEPGAAPASAATQSASGAKPQPDLQTWMEIYWLNEGCDLHDWVNGPLRQQIEARALAAGVQDLVHGERHYEAFESCA